MWEEMNTKYKMKRERRTKETGSSEDKKGSVKKVSN